MHYFSMLEYTYTRFHLNTGELTVSTEARSVKDLGEIRPTEGNKRCRKTIATHNLNT